MSSPQAQEGSPEVEDEATNSAYERGAKMTKGFLNKLFTSCSEDPKGSVHRAWGISLLFVVLYFILSVIESKWSR